MTDPATIKDLEAVFTNIVKVLMAAGAFGLFIMLLTSGFKYLTSSGDPKAVEGAKKTLTYAIGGFVALAFSYLILRLIGMFTGTDTIITNFTIVKP
ncbi:MAG: hypothetical protein UR39_C0017G0013 [Candidatus Woesebacteria bacterium GW2011_GWA1_33_30]|uniref:Integral membrane protein n=1 Tax=Candidatus Woesebacteria bacterium GW2011_GWA2_33_28 TaxID=1618561 RepID=A0A0G0C416_9BACT|nr:MAG: hypothetical protein UR38_C0015G0012 [Candidatus Woesebacteria bacterium GW2011_GWA2_33_28]KKP46347.1 MAG: hypothetical protein UR39_C0017G0013 [Candidatus Woesebacteria bacterium GW2011_GWA1_33_30]KKP47841.1 MAG: hypothetical protein UR40_C0017G0012 [Microgenomates group bacterium GW2011_GWC1_33_32]KKP51279.1 MAG: hypothetical protein UR44_C0014G0012 [Candidatus Woesebacteria bacterium GW2011_GWB1_33_38]KKP55747.1 MAG: hypothetical protein UR48_C0052G0001 [Microgenomates group bacteriu